MQTENAVLPKVGVLLYTYNRTDDARINMEIIRNEWKKIPLLSDVTIVHAFNGKEEWWPAAYLEDTLVRTDNPGHFAGAELLLNAGIETFIRDYPEVTHVILLAADTWCVKPKYVAQVVRGMQEKGAYLATSAWGNAKDTDMFKIGMSIDFSVFDMDFVKRSGFFPLRYQEFVGKYEELLAYQNTVAFLERVFALRFKQAVTRTETIPSENLIIKVARAHIYHLTEREPIHYDLRKLFEKPKGVRKMYWPKLGLITHHDPKDKQNALRKWKIALGEHGRRFLEAKDLAYFNNGLKRTTFKKSGKEIDYND